MGVYKKPYSKNELNCLFSMAHTGSDTVNFVLKTGDKKIEVEFNATQFRKTDGTATVIPMDIRVRELVVASSGGVDFEALIANLNREKPSTQPFTLKGDDELTPLVVDESGSLSMVFERGEASKAGTQRTPLGLKYSLKRNTEYLIQSNIESGSNSASESDLYALVREV